MQNQNLEPENLQQSSQQASPQANQASKSLFVVSSAIHTRFGVYDAETRLNQTIETCKSIRARCDADIIVLDGGQERITQEERDILSPYIDRFYDFAEEPTVQEIQKAGGNNWDIVKNMIEIVMFGSFFELLSKGRS